MMFAKRWQMEPRKENQWISIAGVRGLACSILTSAFLLLPLKKVDFIIDMVRGIIAVSQHKLNYLLILFEMS